MPLVDEEDMQEHANEQVLSMEKVFRDTAIDVLSQGDIPNFPDKQDFKTGKYNFILSYYELLIKQTRLSTNSHLF